MELAPPRTVTVETAVGYITNHLQRDFSGPNILSSYYSSTIKDLVRRKEPR